MYQNENLKGMPMHFLNLNKLLENIIFCEIHHGQDGIMWECVQTLSTMNSFIVSPHVVEAL